MPRGLSDQQKVTAAAVKRRAEAMGLASPLMLPRPEWTAAHFEGYPQLADADPKTVSSYVSSNQRSVRFWQAMGFESADMRQWLGAEILRNLQGENPVFPKDIYRDSLKIAARLTFEGQSDRDDGANLDYRSRSDAELEFFIRHGRWPDSAPAPGAPPP